VAKLLGKPILMKFSGSNTILPLTASPVGRLQLRLLSLWAFRIMVLNAGMVAEGKECGLDPSKFLWMPNPVDTEQFCPAPKAVRAIMREQLGVDAGAEVILFVGRLAPEKELASLIEAFSRVAKQRNRAHLVLVGDGPLRLALDALVEQRGLRARVTFAGSLPAPDVLRWLQAADVFTLVSSVEGLPVSLIEAMAVGLPSVVSDIPANTQLIEAESTGVVAKLRDVESLGGALLQLLENPEMRVQMGQAARKRVEHDYSTVTVGEMYENLFSEALGGGDTSR
jgi:glycosyltransferase involved in cell wall biosynthesis